MVNDYAQSVAVAVAVSSRCDVFLGGLEMKTCTCCARSISESMWTEMPLVGIQEVPAFEGEPGWSLQLKNCACGSTLAEVIS